jgi:putative phosphoesterase
MTKKIGLISDTHGLLRPEAIAALQGTDLIIHAGDVGRLDILAELQTIAPVVAIRGNVDTDDWATELPDTAIAKVNGESIFVIHDLHDGAMDTAASGCRMVVSGHSHQPGQTERDGVLYVNPGSAGPRRFRLPVTIALVDVSETEWRVSFVELLHSILK